MIKVEQKIKGVRLREQSAPAGTPAPALPDINPLDVRIENRPEEALDAVIDKVAFYTQEGKKKVYLAVTFMEVAGRINGEEIKIERPIEVFLPAGQSGEDGQWIVATMRSLSLAARGGYLTRALQDLRQVPWTKGPVKLGTIDYGNGKKVPIQHPSEVAAVAYAIQRILHKRGFVDSEGGQVPAEVLSKRYRLRTAGTNGHDPNDLLDEVLPPPPDMAGSQHEEPAKAGPKCERCGGEVRRLDGCDTCVDCGHSKCG